MKKKWKIVIGASFAVIVLFSLIYQQLKPLEITVAEATLGDIAKTFKEEGIVRAENETYVSSVYGGKITSVHVREGDLIQKGDVLVTFDSQEIGYQIQSLQGQLRSIEAQKHLQEMTIDLETAKILYEAGVISQKEYEDAKNTIHSDYYPALLSAVRAQINQLYYQVSLGNTAALNSGTIANLQIKEGMVVPPGSPLMTIISGEGYKIETYVLTEDAASIETGMPVLLIQTSKSGNISFPGTVERIAPTAVEKISPLGLIQQRLKITIVPEIPSGLLLKPGFALDVEFTVERLENQVIVPKTVLFPYNGGEALWVVEAGKAYIRPVIKGFENDRHAAIIDGLTEGDLIILNPKHEELKPGKRIKR